MSFKFENVNNVPSLTYNESQRVFWENSKLCASPVDNSFAEDTTDFKKYMWSDMKHMALVAKTATLFGDNAIHFLRAGRSGDKEVLDFLNSIEEAKGYDDFSEIDFTYGSVRSGEVTQEDYDNLAESELLLDVTVGGVTYAIAYIYNGFVNVLYDNGALRVFKMRVTVSGVKFEAARDLKQYAMWLGLYAMGLYVRSDIKVLNAKLKPMDKTQIDMRRDDVKCLKALSCFDDLLTVEFPDEDI